MKRFISIFSLIALVMTLSLSASAQGVYVKAGLTYGKSVCDFSDINVQDYTGWQIGAGYQTEPTMGFSLQPELIYTIRGAKIGDFGDVRMSYLELPLNIQWGLDLVVLKPFVFAAPFVGYNVKNAVSKTVTQLKDILDETKKFEYGMGLGAGIELGRRLQITGKYDWNFGNVNSWDEYVTEVKSIDRTTGALILTLGLRF